MFTENKWLLSLAVACTFGLSACNDTDDPELEPDIASMRLTVGTGTTAQTITVAKSGCARTGNPITLTTNAAATPIAISFLNAAGQPDVVANDAAVFKVAGASPSPGATPAAEPVPTPSTITWARTGPFAGTLRGTAATTAGSVTFSGLHIEEGHADFECAVAITVQ